MQRKQNVFHSQCQSRMGAVTYQSLNLNYVLSQMAINGTWEATPTRPQNSYPILARGLEGFNKIDPVQRGIGRDAVAWNANASLECLLRVGPRGGLDADLEVGLCVPGESDACDPGLERLAGNMTQRAR